MDATADRLILALFQSGDYDDPLGTIDRSIVDLVKGQMIGPDSCARQIDIWIESPGGDANAAYKLLLFLRSRCESIRAIVADYAKSAATLISIGCDEIYMAPDAELGPLDIQIKHPDRENVTVSGLDVAKSLGFLANLAAQSMIVHGKMVLDSTALTRLDVLPEMVRFAAKVIRPVVGKLDPHLIHQAANELEIAQRYATILLLKRSLSAEDESCGAPPKQIAEHLVNHYPAHDFVISRDEARDFGLPVKALERYVLTSLLMRSHRLFRRGCFSSEKSGSMVCVWQESELEEFVGRIEDIEFGDDEDESDGEHDNAPEDSSGNEQADDVPGQGEA